MASEERFGYEWDTYRTLDPNYELQFQKWLGPITPQFIKGKRVLDAGCGMGRNSYWCLEWGAGEVVAFDNDPRTVAAAQKTLKKFPNARVLEESIYDISYDREFDFIFSIGVVHHLQYPERAIENFVRALKPGGTLLVWLYGYENNEKLLRVLDPLRKYFTSHLPPSVLHVCTYVLSVPFWMYLKIFRPQDAYSRQLQTFSFRHIHSIIFDQLLPKIARYYQRGEALQLLSGLTDVEITHINGMSWTVAGKKPSA